jgi:hypothetical protein
MNHRTLGKTGFKISEVSLGTWQVGGKWGSPFDHKLADTILLNTAVDGASTSSIQPTCTGSGKVNRRQAGSEQAWDSSLYQERQAIWEKPACLVIRRYRAGRIRAEGQFSAVGGKGGG